MEDQYVIQLFRGANLSTLTHETAHVFFLEMERLEREGLADERLLADLAVLREWTAAMDDAAAFRAEYERYQKHSAYGGAEFDTLPGSLKEDARSRAKQKMPARGFEQYLREGKAPSRKLEGVFARFRKWLMRVYRDALNLHVELTDDVRDVFDRMLAHEEEMELRAEDDALERSAIEGELERLRAEMTRAVTSAPHLMGQITSGTDAETSVGQYVDAQLGLIVRRARELTRMGVPMSDTLSRVSFEGLVKDEYGRMVTPEEADALAQRDAEEEALAPFWDTVWGRLNADSLRVDFPDARREPAYQHGRGLFAKKGEGLSVDALADELRERGLLDSDADSSTLIERLKGMRRPDRRTRGKVGALFQVEGETIVAMQHRISECLSPENLAQAQGKTREEIFAMFGNELEPIAVLPPQYLHYFRQAGSDNRIYSGKGYFIDHAVNHHPEVSSERYQDIQLILNSPDEVLLDRRPANAKVRDGLIFVKELDANYAVAVSMEEGSDGKIVMHKTFFKTKKNPFKKLERVPTSVGGVSTISHAAETVPGSSLSARDVEINITSYNTKCQILAEPGQHLRPWLHHV